MTPLDDGVAIDSPLAGLRAKRELILEKLHHDLRVPRWEDPEIWVRYRPANPSKAIKASKARRAQKVEDWVVLANLDVLVDACIGVYAVVDGKTYALDPDAPDDEWPRFDKRVAAALGIEATKAVDVARALFFTDADIIRQANELAQWSGLTETGIDDEFSGE